MAYPAEIIQIEKTARCLYSAEQLDHAIRSMANAITQRLSNSNPLCLCVLNGGIILAGKLLPHLAFPLNLDSVNATRYGNQTVGNDIQWLYRPAIPMHKRTVLILDDILDEGITLAAIRDFCLQQGAEAVFSAVLVNKQIDRNKPIHADFIGVQADNFYLFGYGMDYKGYLRNAPGLFACQSTSEFS